MKQQTLISLQDAANDIYETMYEYINMGNEIYDRITVWGLEGIGEGDVLMYHLQSIVDDVLQEIDSQ